MQTHSALHHPSAQFERHHPAVIPPQLELHVHQTSNRKPRQAHPEPRIAQSFIKISRFFHPDGVRSQLALKRTKFTAFQRHEPPSARLRSILLTHSTPAANLGNRRRANRKTSILSRASSSRSRSSDACLLGTRLGRFTTLLNANRLQALLHPSYIRVKYNGLTRRAHVTNGIRDIQADQLARPSHRKHTTVLELPPQDLSVHIVRRSLRVAPTRRFILPRRRRTSDNCETLLRALTHAITKSRCRLPARPLVRVKLPTLVEEVVPANNRDQHLQITRDVLEQFRKRRRTLFTRLAQSSASRTYGHEDQPSLPMQ